MTTQAKRARIAAPDCLAQVNWRNERERVQQALPRYSGERQTGDKYFLAFNHGIYPPKDIRSIMEGRAKSEFSGGKSTNDFFNNLGFAVVNDVERAAEFANADKDKTVPVSILDKWIRSLFEKKWQPLNEYTLKLDEFRCPGVYLLGFAPDLNKQQVDIADVFYVGMSATSLQQRLGQFLRGIEDGKYHSGAMRFFRIWAKRTPFSELKTKNNFFVAAYSVAECEPEKALRTPSDLQNLGLVAALEYFALAHIKAKLGLEPPLNKK